MELLRRAEEPGFEVAVYETDELYGEKGRFRVLQFADGDVQGALDLNDPKRIVLEYPRAIVHLMEHNDPGFERAFIVGHGIGTIAGHFAGRDIRTAEISPTIAEWSRTFFGYAGPAAGIGDGRELLEREADGSLDYIVLDAFTEKGTPWHLFTREFWKLARRKLNESGTILLNVFGRGRRDSFVEAVWAGLSETFAHTRGFALPTDDPRDPTNRILVGAKRPIQGKLRRMAGFEPSEPEPGTVLEDVMFGYSDMRR
ncbi:spermidine synthase [Saccharibacillus alkalitolerans]|uniref:Spermidine synthase n=1 Tax=Saccharibacillus alkalitolerans TaxID=2705290 RepID=A0ABX0FB86_9BACL|nr:fused MFS/spermidine synthase [Saccharibacillus alkalitolerans]NGZ75282.1 spermidine synthase [Saccharibacillus alkalitolerans]